MTPEWVHNAIFYQIFPDRFCNGDSGNDPAGVLPWDSRPSRISFFGGDLLGIVGKLDYLQDLGVNTLYLTPIFEAPSNHKYDTTNYFRVDPAFGGDAALKELVAALHERKMRIVLDGVFNHCSEEHPFFQDIIMQDQKSPYWNWFTISGDQIVREPESNYKCWAGVRTMPEWNHKNPNVWEYLLSVVRYWIREYAIDGWRLDTVEYLPPDFVRGIYNVAKQEKPDIYILGEVMGIATSWFKHNALDGVMHYKLWEALTNFFAKGDWDAPRFAIFVRSIWHSYPENANYNSYTLLGSHDKPRFLTLCGGDKRRLILAASFLFTFPGAPAIYYGDEIGLEGEDDPDCRRSFPWKEEAWDRDLLECFRWLAQLRRQEECLRRGTIEFISAREQHLVFSRKLGQEEIIIAINTGDKDAPLDLTSPGNWIDLFTEARLPKTTVIPGRGFLIVKRI